MPHPWLAQRAALFDSSGIRKVFDLAATMTDPIDLSIGQPDFEVPKPIQDAAIKAIRGNKNAYSPTQGIGPLVDHLQATVDDRFGHPDRRVLVTSGTSGGLVLIMLAMIDPGDEVILFDPYFVMYEALVSMVGGTPIIIDTYPDFRIDPDRVAAAITPRTKMILLNSPANPTGVVTTEQETRAIAELAAKRNVAVISDEIYRAFCYTSEPVSAAAFNEQTIVIDGFSKSYAMTGWRVGYAHGPSQLIEKLAMIQQYSFVCAPQPFQWAAIAAAGVDQSATVDAYRNRRDLLLEGLRDHFEITHPEGAFYAFPKAPRGTGTEFVERAIRSGVLVIPGKIFSRRDTHFRISYATSLETLERGVTALNDLARGGPEIK